MTNNSLRMKMSGASYPVVVISLCACFLFYKYVLQIYPSIITDQLMQEFHLTGANLGNLAATFYYAYIIVQLFVGVILDKYSARYITTIAIFSCALGAYLFSVMHSLLAVQLSRALMGAGVAFATVAYMKLAANWFAPQRYAFVSGLLATAAMAGAVFGEAPLSFAISEFGWRSCLMMVGIAGFVLSALFLIVVRDAPIPVNQLNVLHKPLNSFNNTLSVFKNKQNWLLTLYSGLAFCPIAVFGGLWGNPFLQTAYHLNKTQSSFLVSLIFVGLGVGSPLLGILSDRLGDRRNIMLSSTLISFVAISLVLYSPTLPLWLLGFLLFLFGFALGAFMLVFAIAKEMNLAILTATVIAMINSSDAILDAVTEPTIGKLLDITWDGNIVNGAHHFSLHSYHIALSVLPFYLCIGSLLLLFVKFKSSDKK